MTNEQNSSLFISRADGYGNLTGNTQRQTSGIIQCNLIIHLNYSLSDYYISSTALEQERLTFKFLCLQVILNLRGSFFSSMSFFFLRPYLEHTGVPRLGVELELQLQACATAMATPDLSCTCDLCHSLQQCQILQPTE